ncbi:MAG: GGDEF domain-containing protein [Aquabacterium sp.]|nr:GGDEF domain-containing protein [Aquabacterium sp.]
MAKLTLHLISLTFLGPTSAMRRAILRLAWMLCSYSFVLVSLVLAVYLDRVDAAPARLLGGYILAGGLTFYALLRSGWAHRHNSPTMACPQVLFSIGAVLLAYATIPFSRTLALQWLCLILVFDMHRLQTAQIWACTALALAGLFGIVGYEQLTHTTGVNRVGEWINMGMTAITLPVLVTVSGLARRLRRQNERQRLEMAEALSQMQMLAIHDGLTRTLTRRHMQQLLDEEVSRQKRTRRVFCVAMLDLDWFKQVNDRLGHAVGDAVLIDFAAQVQSALDKGHAVARWGGEEFLILMPETSLPEAITALQRIRLAVHKHDWQRHAGNFRLTFSAGVSQHTVDDKPERILAMADGALYTAKSTGRDRTCAAPTSPEPEAVST